MNAIRGTVAGLALALFAHSAGAQRRVEQNRVYSDSLPSVILALDPSLTYLGTQSFVLYNVANAEQHFFAELDGKRVKRLVWIQFEGYLPSSHGRYDYSADSIVQLWKRPIHHSAELYATPTSERRPDSDGAKARQFLRDRSLTMPSSMLYHRLVWVVDDNAKNELMIIYMEDPADISAGSVQESLNASLKKAERSIRMEKR